MSLFRIETLPHLLIPQVAQNAERYRPQRGGGGKSPQGGDREKVAKNFEVAIDRVEEQARDNARQLPSGIDPNLVFQMPLYEGVDVADLEKKLDRVGMGVVSIDPDKSIIVVFRADADLSAFREAVQTYKTPRDGSKSTVYDVLEWVKADEMRTQMAQDRIGPRLAEVIGTEGEFIDDSEVYPALDVELWPRGLDAKTAQKDLEELRKLVQSTQFPIESSEAVLDTYAGASMCLARVRLSGVRLRHLLQMGIVASVDFPPQPYLSRGEIMGGTADDLPTPPKPPENGPRLCVLDSGITSGHPFLEANVGYEEAFLTVASTVADGHGHGTRVAGIALYGNVARCIKEKRFESPITLYSGRILNDRNELDNEKLFITQIKSALDTFTKTPYECRVFNVSVGRPEAWIPGKQTLWGEALDKLAREYGVLFVVSAGNATGFEVPTRSGDDAEVQLSRYHSCLLEDEWRLCDPAMSSIAVTVGAIADSESPILNDDIKRAVAKVNEPSPFTRSGAGVRQGVKPEFVANGGNLVFQGTGQMRGIGRDPATNVISLSRNVVGDIFSTGIGTSYAAPQVTRIASLVEWELWQSRQERPHPNLVRAVLATAASIPDEAQLLFASEDVYRTCGYGRIDEENALHSKSNRVLLCAESEIEIDHFTLFRVPAPQELLDAKGEKKVTVALAFDPPVLARRNDYLGVEMGFKLIRGLSEQEVVDACRKFTKEETEDDKVRDPLAPNTVTLLPKDTTPKANVSRKRSTLQCASHSWRKRMKWGVEDDWYLVVRSEDRWAKNKESKQKFAVAVVLEADNDFLYNAVRRRVQIQPRVQVRA